MTYRKSTSDEMMRAWCPYSHALTVIDEEHRMVHDGAGFQGDQVQLSLTNGSTGNVLLVTGAKPAHIRSMDVAVTNSPCTVSLYEGATYSAIGTAIATLIDVNRVTANTPLLAMYYGATITANGTKLTSGLAPAPAKDAGTVQSEFGEEIILAPNTVYLLTVTNNSGATIDWGFKCFFYEVPDFYSQ